MHASTKHCSKTNSITARRNFIKSALLAGSGCLASMQAFAQDSRFASGNSAVVPTGAGQVQGLRYAGGVQAFYGIPYAASTSGDNRFKKPQPVKPWSGIRETKVISDRCPQAPSGPNGPVTEVFSLDRKETMSEECLSINVFTPDTDNRQRPVMVWLHGGGYTTGSGGWLLYDGSNLAATQDVVVVVVNHRLNIYGHLYLQDLAGDAYADSGNAGMLDIVAVLEWVRDNIENFGGSPDNVTLFGQSGGAGKVSTLMAMPAAKGLFHKAITMSGAALTGIPAATATATTEKFMAALGLGRNQVSGLHSLPAEQLLATFLGTPGLNMGPVLDGSNLPANPFSPAAPAISANIPLLLGTVEHEVNFLPGTPLEAMDDTVLLQQVKTLLGGDEARASTIVGLYKSGRADRSNVELYQIIASDMTFRRGVLTQADLKAEQKGAPAYMYYFTWQSPVRDGKLRAYHCLDIPFAFNNVDVCAAMVGADQNRYRMASRMSSAFANFARSGDPNHDDLPRWAPYDAENRPVMVMNDNPALVNDPYGTERQALYR